MQLPEGWKLILDESSISSRRQVLARRLAKGLENVKSDIVLCCILKGAAYFTVDLSRDLQDIGFEHTLYFVEASSYKDGRKQQDTVELLSKLVVEKFVNKHVVLLDELYDNGKTMHTMKQHLQALPISGLTTCVMFCKKHAKPKYEMPDFIGVDVPCVWLVGYGLDDCGHKRGLRSLWAVPKPKGNNDWTSDDWKIFAIEK